MHNLFNIVFVQFFFIMIKKKSSITVANYLRLMVFDASTGNLRKNSKIQLHAEPKKHKSSFSLCLDASNIHTLIFKYD